MPGLAIIFFVLSFSYGTPAKRRENIVRGEWSGARVGQKPTARRGAARRCISDGHRLLIVARNTTHLLLAVIAPSLCTPRARATKNCLVRIT